MREFGIKKKLSNLPYLLQCMDNCNKRLLTWEDTIDQTTVSARFVEKLGQPTVRENGRRVPGLKLHDPRLYQGLAAVLQFVESSFAPNGTAKGLPSCALGFAPVTGTHWAVRRLSEVLVSADT